jgi:transcriptional regulator with XRE-family HTH domain
MDWKTELGIQIREGRRDSFLRQEDLRERAQVHVNMISRYERGAAAPELDVLIRLAVALEKEEFRIGDYRISISPANEAGVPSSDPRQMRLEYGKEYVFHTDSSSVKIQPSKEGLFICPQKGKVAS